MHIVRSYCGRGRAQGSRNLARSWLVVMELDGAPSRTDFLFPPHFAVRQEPGLCFAVSLFLPLYADIPGFLS
jgi:hypothetical protein